MFLHIIEIPTSNIEYRSRLRARFSRLLHSVSNLAVSAPRHEVYVVALQGATSTQLVLARNAAVSKKTTEHIDTLWQYFKKMAKDYAKFHKLSNLAESPLQAKGDKLPPSTCVHIIQFRREAFKFCGTKLQKRFSKYLESFKWIDCSGHPPKSSF